MVNTRGAPACIAYTALPVGVSSPMRSFCVLLFFSVMSSSKAGWSRPYCFRSVALPSTRRSEFNEDDRRQHELAGDTYEVQLRAGHRNAAVFRLLRANGNQIFIRRQPVDGVQSQVIVAVEIDESVGGPQ